MINLTKKDILQTGQDLTIPNMKKAYKLIFIYLLIWHEKWIKLQYIIFRKIILNNQFND